MIIRESHIGATKTRTHKVSNIISIMNNNQVMYTLFLNNDTGELIISGGDFVKFNGSNLSDNLQIEPKSPTKITIKKKSYKEN